MKPRRFLAPVSGSACQLVGAASGDGGDQELPVKAVRRKLASELIQELRVAGRVLATQIVHGLDKAGSEKVSPESIHGGAGEERILRCGHPVRERDARTHTILPVRLLAVKKRRRNHLARSGNGKLSFVVDFADVPGLPSG